MRERLVGTWAVLLALLLLLGACGELEPEERREQLEGVWRSAPVASEFGLAVVTLALQPDGTYSLRFDPVESDLPAWTGRGIWRVEDRWLVLEGMRELRRHMALREDALDLAGTGDEATWRLHRVR